MKNALRTVAVVAVVVAAAFGYVHLAENKGYALKAVFQPGSEFGIDTSGGVLASTIGWTPGTGVLAAI